MDIREYFQSRSTEVNSSTSLALELSTDDARMINTAIANSKRKSAYMKWTDEQRLEIGEYACHPDHSNDEILEKFRVKYPSLTRQTAQNFKKLYMNHREKFTHLTLTNPDIDISQVKIPTLKKQGRPTILPAAVMDFCVGLIDSIRMKGAVISGSVIRGIIIGALEARYPDLMDKESIEYRHVRQVLYHYQKTRPKLVRRRATTAKLPVPEGLLKEIKLTFQQEISSTVRTYNIPESLILNHDQTPLTYVSVSSQTLAPQGSTVIGVSGTKDKRQITGNFAVTLEGDFLPMQIIYQGKTNRCEPKFQFPPSFHITHTHNHWSNTLTSVQFFEKILLPQATSSQLGHQSTNLTRKP